MPKKKLTKTLVKRKLLSIRTNIMALIIDKMEYGSSSHIPVSADKLISISKTIVSAVTKVK